MTYFAAHFEEQLKLYKKQVSVPHQSAYLYICLGYLLNAFSVIYFGLWCLQLYIVLA